MILPTSKVVQSFTRKKLHTPAIRELDSQFGSIIRERQCSTQLIKKRFSQIVRWCDICHALPNDGIGYNLNLA
jgi:hypothetical protein